MSVPNMLSIFRLILVPVFAVVFFSDRQDAYVFAAFVYAIACLTDVLDGIIARRFNQITRLGRVLDPLADKLMGFTVLACITIEGIIPVWSIIIIFIKDGLMGIGALLMYNRTDDVMPSDKFGKAATACFFVVCVILMLITAIPHEVATAMIAVPTAIAVLALLHYLKLFLRILKDSKS